MDIDIIELQEENLNTIVNLINKTTTSSFALSEEEKNRIKIEIEKKEEERNRKIDELKDKFIKDANELAEEIKDFKNATITRINLKKSRLASVNNLLETTNSYIDELKKKYDMLTDEKEKVRLTNSISIIEEENIEIKIKKEQLQEELNEINTEFLNFLKTNKEEFNSKYKVNSQGKFDPNKQQEIIEINKEIEQLREKLDSKINKPEQIKNDIMEALKNKDYVQVQNLFQGLKALIPAYILSSVKNKNTIDEEIEKLENKIKDLELEATAVHVNFIPKADANRRKKQLEENLELNLGKIEEYQKKVLEINKMAGGKRLRTQLKQLKIERKNIENNIINLEKEPGQNIDKINELRDKLAIIEEKCEKINDVIENGSKYNINNITEEIKKLTLENQKINEEIGKIDAKIKNGEYLEKEQSKKDKEKLQNYQEKLEKMNQAKEVLNGKSILEIEKSIFPIEKSNTKIENYEFEEILEFKPAKISLIEKIKKPNFIKKAILSIAAIGISATIAITGMTNFINKHQKNGLDKKYNKTIEFEMEENKKESINNLIEETINKNQTENNNAKEETTTSIDENAINDILTEELNAVINGEKIYTNVYDAANLENGVDAYIPSWEATLEQQLNSVGKFYAIVEGEPKEISFDEVENYLSNDYKVVTSVQNDDSTIGYINLDSPAKTR